MAATVTGMDAGGDFPRKGWHEITMAQAMAQAQAAGYRPTSHGTLQRGPWRAIEITPAPGGVMVKGAWTTAQLAVVGVFLVLLVIGVCGVPR